MDIAATVVVLRSVALVTLVALVFSHFSLILLLMLVFCLSRFQIV